VDYSLVSRKPSSQKKKKKKVSRKPSAYSPTKLLNNTGLSYLMNKNKFYLFIKKKYIKN
jgi:hypothetical protein